MATPPTIDIDALLTPIADDDPAGPDISDDNIMDELKDAYPVDRRDPYTYYNQYIPKWQSYLDALAETLQTKSKHLMVAAWMVEALTHVHGFAGLRDGLRLFKEIQDRFWEGCHPRVDDGELENRMRPFSYLDNDTRMLPMLARVIPLAPRSYSLSELDKAVYIERMSREESDPDKRQQLLQTNRVSEGQIRESWAKVPWKDHQLLFDNLNEAIQAAEDLEAMLAVRYEPMGYDRPNLDKTSSVLSKCREQLEPILKAKKPVASPTDPIIEKNHVTKSETPPSGLTEGSPTSGDSRNVEGDDSSAPAFSGAIETPEQAIAAVIEAARVLRQNDIANPVPYLLIRALRLGELYQLPRPFSPEMLPAPSRSWRQELGQLEKNQDWARLSNQTEDALAQPMGRAWLDAHRLSILALEGQNRTQAAHAVRSFLKMVRTDIPDLDSADLADFTASANNKTRAWFHEALS